MWEHPALIAAIAAIGTILAAWGGQLIKGWLSLRARRKEADSVLDGLERSQASYSILSSMRTDTTASRVLLLAGHNGGGYPRPDAPFYTSVLFWSIDDSAQESIKVMSQYKQLPVDAEYIRLLLDTEKEGYTILDVERMPPCQLKRYYQAEGVKHSILFYLEIKDRKFLYCSVAKFDSTPFTEVEVTSLSLKAETLKKLL